MTEIKQFIEAFEEWLLSDDIITDINPSTDEQ